MVQILIMDRIPQSMSGRTEDLSRIPLSRVKLPPVPSLSADLCWQKGRDGQFHPRATCVAVS